MKQHIQHGQSKNRNVVSLNAYKAQLEPLKGAIQVSGYINQDVRQMKPGDPILIRLLKGGFAVGFVGGVEGDGDGAIVRPDCAVPFEELDCVVGRIVITDCDACFDLENKEAC